MLRRVAFAAIFALLTVSALTSSAQQKAARETVAPFRTVRGSVIAGDANATPLGRVRIALTASNTVASPAYTDEQGRFEMSVPASAPYELRLTKPGFAPQDVSRVASDPTDDLRITLAVGAAVNGRVTDQFGDPLLVGVRVRRVADAAGRRVPLAEWLADTDDLGEFRAGSLPAGRYEVRVDPLSPPGTGAVPSPSSRAPAVVDVHPGDEATLSLVEETKPMDPRGRVIGSSRTPVVENGGTIRGRVVGPDARSVGGAFVILTAGIEGAREAATDVEGRFEFAGLPAGSYRITAAKLGTAFVMRDRSVEVTVDERQRKAAVDVVMQKRSAVIGTVVDHHGDPVEGLSVELWRLTHRDGRDALQRPEGPSPRRTDDRGRYRLFRVTPGEYYVAAGEEPRVRRGTAEGPDSSLRVYYPGTSVVADGVRVRVASGEDTAGIDITHAPPTGARVYGSAFDSTGRPLSSPVILVESSRSGPMQAERTARVRQDGAFEFLNVPPGDYVVQGLLRPTPGRSSESGFAFVSVAATDATPVTLRTSRGTTVRGRVVFEGDTTNAQPDSFGVGAYPSDADYALIGADSPGAGVEEDGTFELRLQGPMRIAATAAPPGWWLKSATIGTSDAADQPYTFAATGPAVALTVIFSDSGAEVSGRVVGDRGQGLREGWVLAFPSDPALWYRGSRYIKVARPSAEGRFRLSALPPSDYWILALDRFDNAERQDADVLLMLARSAHSVTVFERQRLVRDLPLVHRP